MNEPMGGMNGIKDGLRRAFGARNLGSRPVAVALICFVLVMAFLGLAALLSTWSEAAMAAIVFLLFKTLLLVLFLVFAIVILARGVAGALARNDEYLRRKMAAEAPEPSERELYAHRVLEDDAFYERLRAAEIRRLRNPSRRMRPDGSDGQQ